MPGEHAPEEKPPVEGTEADLPSDTGNVGASGVLPAPPLVEEPAAMLEAHASHEGIHSWKGFFIHEKIWLVSFMRYDLGFFDHQACRIESAANPFAAKLLPLSPV